MMKEENTKKVYQNENPETSRMSQILNFKMSRSRNMSQSINKSKEQ